MPPYKEILFHIMKTEEIRDICLFAGFRNRLNYTIFMEMPVLRTFINSGTGRAARGGKGEGTVRRTSWWVQLASFLPRVLPCDGGCQTPAKAGRAGCPGFHFAVRILDYL